MRDSERALRLERESDDEALNLNDENLNLQTSNHLTHVTLYTVIAR